MEGSPHVEFYSWPDSKLGLFPLTLPLSASHQRITAASRKTPTFLMKMWGVPLTSKSCTLFFFWPYSQAPKGCVPFPLRWGEWKTYCSQFRLPTIGRETLAYLQRPNNFSETMESNLIEETVRYHGLTLHVSCEHLSTLCPPPLPSPPLYYESLDSHLPISKSSSLTKNPHPLHVNFSL